MEVSYGSQGLNPSHSSGNPKSSGHQGTPAGTVFKRVFGEFLLWYNRIDIVSAAPGHRFSLRHSGLKDPIAIGHSCSSDLIPDLQTPYGSGPPKMIKKKKKGVCFPVWDRCYLPHCQFESFFFSIYLCYLVTSSRKMDIRVMPSL